MRLFIGSLPKEPIWQKIYNWQRLGLSKRSPLSEHHAEQPVWDIHQHSIQELLRTSTSKSRRKKSLNTLFLRIFLSRNTNPDNEHQSHYSIHFAHTAVLDGDMCIPCAVNLFQMRNMQIITYFLIKKLTDQGPQDVDAHAYRFYYAPEDHLPAARYGRSAYMRIDQGLF